MDFLKKPLEKTQRELENHPAFKNPDGSLNTAGKFARHTGTVASFAPGTASVFFGPAAVRHILLLTSNQAIRKSAHDSKLKELEHKHINDILQDADSNAMFTRLTREEGSTTRAEQRLRGALAEDYAKRVQAVHGILTVGGRIFTHHSTEAANTAFSQFIRNLSLANLYQLAPRPVVDWMRGTGNMDKDTL